MPTTSTTQTEETRMDASDTTDRLADRLPPDAGVAQLAERRLPKITEARSVRSAGYQRIRTTMRVCAGSDELCARAETAANGADDASGVAGVAA